MEPIHYATNSSKKRTKPEWLQVYPYKWNQRFEKLLKPNLIKEDFKSVDGLNDFIHKKNKVVLNTRVNFSFDAKKYYRMKQSLHLSRNCDVEKSTEYI